MWARSLNVLHCTASDACVTCGDTQRKLSWFNMLFACWLIHWENISKMSSFSWARMHHSGLFHLWMSLWFTVQISSAGQAAPMLKHWHRQKRNSFCMSRNRCFVLLHHSICHSFSHCKSQLIWVDFTQQRGMWDYFISMKLEVIALSYSKKPIWLRATSFHKLYIYIHAQHV